MQRLTSRAGFRRRLQARALLGTLRGMLVVVVCTIAGLALAALIPVLIVAVMIAGCVAVPAGKDALTLRGTVLGHMPAPPGSALVSERYVPASFNINTGRDCAMYERTFATNDVRAFARSVHTTARSSGRIHIINFNPDAPNINTLEGLYGAAGYFEGEGVSASLAFFDLDAGWRGSFEHSIDVGAWRWAAWIIVYDSCKD